MNRALASLAIGAILLAGCSPRNQTATTNSDSTQMAERSEREHEVAARLDSTRARLDSLKSEAAVLGNKVNSATTAKIAELEVEKDSAQVRFERLQQTGKEKWDEARTSFANLLDSLDVRIDQARHNLRRPSKS